ncbi:hypothetical protein [Nocardia sp. NPDC006630]|uniref:hypothetical protein n=1 Tax=Nocardia sp. NPDC006630 TaxID=3157181 RepID=UPI0033B5EB03
MNSTTTAAATTTLTTTSKPPVADAALPLCGDLDRDPPAEPTDCKLISHDRAGYTFIVRFSGPDPVGHRNRMTITVIADGKVRQTVISTLSSIMREPPELRNLADDGRDQLVVPVDAGTGGTDYEIYRATDSAPEFVDAGEVQGLDEGRVLGMGVQRTPDGYVAAMAKSGPADHYLAFWHFVGARLELVAEIILTYRADGSAPACRADDEGPRGDSGLSDAGVAQRFCGEKTFPATPVP